MRNSIGTTIHYNCYKPCGFMMMAHNVWVLRHIWYFQQVNFLSVLGSMALRSCPTSRTGTLDDLDSCACILLEKVLGLSCQRPHCCRSKQCCPQSRSRRGDTWLQVLKLKIEFHHRAEQTYFQEMLECQDKTKC